MNSLPLLSILEIIAAAEGSLGIAEIKEKTEIPPTTLNRLLNKLTECMYVEKVKHGLYRAGPGLVALGSAVIENAGTIRFRPLLAQLVEITGLNAELYSLSISGPSLLTWIGGQSEFRVRMFPGFRLATCNHPAVAFFVRQFPQATSAWGKQLVPNDQQHWQKMLTDANQNFIIERGYIRPELARACACTSDGRYCIGLSGLISEFTIKDTTLEQIMLGHISRFEKSK
jgi:hypothetical protein